MLKMCRFDDLNKSKYGVLILGFYGLLILVALLVLISAFFSGSETGVMAVNRYRLRHLSKQGNKKALNRQCP